MSTIVELIIVDLKEGVGKDDPVVKKLREGGAKGGLKRQSFGFAVEHPQRLYWALYFENGFEPKDFKWPEGEYGIFKEELKKVATSDFTQYFFTFPSFPHAVTAAPVTEIAIATLKAGIDVAAFKALQDEVMGKLKQAPEVREATYGIKTEAGENLVVLMNIGWTSVEAHTQLVSLPENKAALQGLQSFVEKMNFVHVSYTNITY